jgi:hypothetical protein
MSFYGDATQTVALCSLYNKQLAIQQSEKNMVKYKKEPISDKRFRQHLVLPADDPDFTSFNAYINDFSKGVRWKSSRARVTKLVSWLCMGSILIEWVGYLLDESVEMLRPFFCRLLMATNRLLG